MASNWGSCSLTNYSRNYYGYNELPECLKGNCFGCKKGMCGQCNRTCKKCNNENFCVLCLDYCEGADDGCNVYEVCPPCRSNWANCVGNNESFVLL